jgi:hypothetical protein
MSSGELLEIKPGHKVWIFRSVRGVPVIEGLATVISPCESYEHFFQVCFAGERVNRVRLVIPEFQSDPDRSLKRLRELLRGGDVPFDDFFPEADQHRRLR